MIICTIEACVTDSIALLNTVRFLEGGFFFSFFLSFLGWGLIFVVVDEFGYCQLFLNLNTEECIRRDALRHGSVGAATILKMASKLERPDPAQHPWEAHTITVQPGSNLNATELTAQIVTFLQTPIHGTTSNATPEEVAAQRLARENARRENLASFDHQLDLHTRKIVSATLAALPEKSRATFAQVVNQLRQAFLKRSSKHFLCGHGAASDAATSTAESLAAAVALASADFEAECDIIVIHATE